MEQMPINAAIDCKACGNSNEGAFCNACGEYLHPQRFSLATIFRSIPDIFFDVEQGLLFTIKELFRNPAQAIANFFKGDRSRHYNPIKFVLFMSGLYALLFISFNIHGVEESQYAAIANKEEAAMLEQQTTELQSIINLVSLPFLSLVSWLLFSPKKFFYGEHFIANSFLIGFILFLQIILFPVMYLKNGTVWVDHVLTVITLFTIYFVTRTYHRLFYLDKNNGNLLICVLKTLGVLFSLAIFQTIINPIVINIKLALGN